MINFTEIKPLEETKPNGHSKSEKDGGQVTTDVGPEDMTHESKEVQVEGEPEKPPKEEKPVSTSSKIR